MTTEFYKSILPTMGVRVLAVFRNGLKKAPEHFYYDSHDDLLDAAVMWNGLGKNVYHACAVYRTAESRKGDNVQCMKSLWLDLDVGPNKDYATQKEAFIAAEKFRIELDLPLTHVVGSGGGLHIYQPLTKAIEPDAWDRVADMYRACLDHHGVKHDPSRTTDKASILRIPGTNNYKTTPAKAVTLKRMGDEAAVRVIYGKLKAYADKNLIVVGQPKAAKAAKAAKGKPMATNDIIGNKEYPPSVAETIIEHCAVLAEVGETGGHCSHKTWWGAMSVAKYSTEPEAVAINWTRNREATGHDKFDPAAAMHEWGDYGPATCVNFQKDPKNATHCDNCAHNGKVKSPINLGYQEQPPVSHIDTSVVPDIPKAAGEWKFAAPWIVNAITKATYTGVSKERKITRSTLTSAGVYEQKPFCDRYWQVMRRVRTEGGVWQLEIGYEQYPGRPHKTFLLDSAAVTAPDLLRKEFSARELHIYGGKPAMEKAQDLIRYTQDLLYTYEEETLTYPTMGWATEGNTVKGDLTGEFVLGDVVYRPKQVPQKVLLGETVDVSLRSDFTARGTVAEWSSLVDKIYNRPDVELYQFIIATKFAAPLVRLMGGEGNWHGIPTALGGASGEAKTSTSLVGLSIYAPPSVLCFNAGEKQGDTIMALSIKLGSLRNLPYLMDEMTGASAERVGDIGYMTANGRAKDRGSPNGKMIPNPYRWDTLGDITSNDSLHEILTSLKNQNTQDATKLRVFETHFEKGTLASKFKDVNRSVVEDDLLTKQYGMVGRKWIQFLVDHRVAVTNMLHLRRAAYQVDLNDSSDIRFYKDLLVTVHVAADLAVKRGFIRWDVQKMMKWAEGQLITLRDGVNTKDWDGHISDFIASLHGGTIVTNHMKLGPGKRSNHLEVPADNLRTTAVARKAIADRRFVVTVNAMKDWANASRIQPSTLLEEMVKRGYLMGVIGEKVAPRLINIGSGTTIPRPQAPCYELDYAKIVEYDSSTLPDMTNVIPLNPVTGSVTAPDNEEGAALATP